MTAHDPAVEAAQRASARYETNGQISLQAIDAAHEALRPVQEWFDRVWLNDITDLAIVNALRDLAPLIFSAEETQNG